MNETYVYPDGSARVGSPPFPKLSPKEEAAGKKEPVEPSLVSVDVPSTEEELADNVEQTQTPVKRKPGRPKKTPD